MKNCLGLLCCVLTLAACVVPTAFAQNTAYIGCSRVDATSKRYFTSKVFSYPGSDPTVTVDAGQAFGDFVDKKYSLKPGGFMSAVCRRETSESVAKDEVDDLNKRYVAKGYTIVNTDWAYSK